jgi:hypothetical protein
METLQTSKFEKGREIDQEVNIEHRQCGDGAQSQLTNGNQTHID